MGIEYQQSQDTIQLSMVEACPENWFFNSMDARLKGYRWEGEVNESWYFILSDEMVPFAIVG